MKSPSERRPCRTTVVAAAPHCSRRHVLAASAAATAAFCGLSAGSSLRGSSPVAIAADDLTTVPQTAAERAAYFRWLFFAALRHAQSGPVRSWFEAKKKKDKDRGLGGVVAVMRTAVSSPDCPAGHDEPVPLKTTYVPFDVV